MRIKFFGVATIALLAIVATIPLVFGGPSARAASDAQIEEATTKGLAWLNDQQQGDGHFNSVSPVAATCLALVKFEDRGWELFPSPGGDGPFDPAYQYRQTVEDGLEYVFKQMTVSGALVDVQNSVYETGICMMALAASREPSRIVSAPTSPVDTWSYNAVLQGMLDWMEGAQNTAADCNEGGWSYSAGGGASDNSNSGYATLGIGFAMFADYNFALSVTPSVLTKLDTFVNNIQEPATGGSYYAPCPAQANTVNILKTGNLLYEMKLVDRAKSDATVQAAIGYIENNWNSVAVGHWGFPISWHSGGAPDVGYYQAMFTMMKGLEAYGIDTLGAGIGDWFDEVSTYIYNNKVEPASGKWYWTGTGFGSPAWGGDAVLETAWALLTLEKVAGVPPPTPTPSVGGIVDIPVDSPGALVASAEEGSAGSSVPYSLVLAGALAAGAITLTAGALYARRRLS